MVKKQHKKYKIKNIGKITIIIMTLLFITAVLLSLTYSNYFLMNQYKRASWLNHELEETIELLENSNCSNNNINISIQKLNDLNKDMLFFNSFCFGTET